MSDWKYGDVIRYPSSRAVVMFLRPSCSYDDPQIKWWAIMIEQGYGLGNRLDPGDLVYFTLPNDRWERLSE